MGRSYCIACGAKQKQTFWNSASKKTKEGPTELVLIVPNEDRIHAEFVLTRDCYQYTVVEGVTEAYYNVRCKDYLLEEIQEDIDCEKQRASTMHHTPVYSLRTFENKQKFMRLQKYYNKRSFQILDKDEAEWERNYGW